MWSVEILEFCKILPLQNLYFDLCFKLSGGLGGLGLELIDWLILRGARNLIISSRRGITTGYQRWKIQKWKTRGAKIIICTDDITVKQGVRNLLEKANTLGPIVAIFNLAMVNYDIQISIS